MFEKLLDRPGFSFDRLLSFVLVANAGRIALAAPNQPVRQSQMSRQITELEEYFGRTLMVPRGRTRVLTEAGLELAVLAREMFGGLAAFKEAETGADHFELGAGDSLLRWWVIPRVHQALADAPNVTLSLTSLSSADIISRLEDARLDFGIVPQSERPKNRALQTEPVGSVEYAVFVSKARMAKARARTVEQVLAKVPLALQRSEPRFNESLAQLAKAGGSLVCETFPQACCAVRSGEYVALLPSLAEDELPEKTFARLVPPGDSGGSVRMVLASRPRLKGQRPRAKALVEALARALRR